MKKPIQKGDLCEVVAGLGREKSPNIGLRVTVVALQGEHSRHGRVWRCEGPGVKQLTDTGTYIEVGWADFPVSWLRKIEPPPAPPKQAESKKEVVA